jgi:hypothetical protein
MIQVPESTPTRQQAFRRPLETLRQLFHSPFQFMMESKQQRIRQPRVLVDSLRVVLVHH